MRCPNCGAEVKPGDIFCSECGTKMGVEYKEVSEGNPHMVATVLGYIFGFLGGWLGFVFGVYLLTRDHPRAKFHGKVILVLTVVMIVLWVSIVLLAGAKTPP